MSILRLNDGTELEVKAYTLNSMIIFEVDTDTAKTVMEKITTDNLKNAIIDDVVFTNVVYENATLSPIDEETEKVSITIHLREKTETEIIQERLDEQDAALMELAELIVG